MKNEGITATVDFKLVERENIKAIYKMVYGRKPTETELEAYIADRFPKHNTTDFSKIDWKINNLKLR